jgi:hypothetical protein
MAPVFVPPKKPTSLCPPRPLFTSSFSPGGGGGGGGGRRASIRNLVAWCLFLRAASWAVRRAVSSSLAVRRVRSSRVLASPWYRVYHKKRTQSYDSLVTKFAKIRRLLLTIIYVRCWDSSTEAVENVGKRSSAGIFKQSMGTRNRVGIGLSCSLAELVPWAP